VINGCLRVTYCHLLFERHEVVFSNGLPSESFFPGHFALEGLAAVAAAELDALFPDLRAEARVGRAADAYGEPSRLYSRRGHLPGSLRAFHGCG
jgi:hypothetical protein